MPADFVRWKNTKFFQGPKALALVFFAPLSFFQKKVEACLFYGPEVLKTP